MYHCEVCDVDCPSEYQWDEHLSGWKHAVKNSQRKRDSESAELRASGRVPLCKCQRPSALKKTFKDGPNYGRSFFNCEDSTCNFFQWADAEVGSSLLPLNNNNNNATNHGQTFVLTRPTTNENASNSSLPQHLKQKFSGVNFFFKYDSASSKLSLSFNYNQELIAIIKDHVKGREWNSASKCWLVPEKSIPDALALFAHLGIYVPKHIQQLSQQITSKYGSSASSSITLNVVGKDVYVGFEYDPAVIAVLKQLHPKKRMFLSDTKQWIVALSVLVEFVASLVEAFQVTVPTSLQTMLQGIAEQVELEEAKERLCASISTMKQSMSRSNLTQKDLLFLQEEIKAMDAVPPKTPMEQALVAFRSQQLKEVSEMLQLKMSGLLQPMAIESSKYNNNNNNSNFQKRKRETMEVVVDDCDCGKPWQKVDGVHICRYYGSFQCGRCGHRWTSGYTWKNETQACRECNTENFPIKKQPLAKLESSNIDGPHDIMRCGMCRALGRPCNGRSRSYMHSNDWDSDSEMD